MRDMVAFVPSATSPFHDLSDYVAIPRITGLRLSPDGSWLAASVQTLSNDRKTFVTSIWRIDPLGGAPHRLTRSAEGEGGPRFLPDGSLLFTSKRPAPDNGEGNGGRGGECPRRRPGDVAAARRRRRGTHRRVAARRDQRAGNGRGRAGHRGRLAGAGRRGRAAAQGAQGRRRHRDPARDRPGPLLGPRPRPGRSAAVRRHPAARRRRRNRGLPVRDPRPHPGRGPRTVPVLGGAEPGRNAGRGHLVALARWRAGTPGTCADRPAHRQADRAAHRP